jgi:DNA repair protein RecO (recombination protein O)
MFIRYRTLAFLLKKEERGEADEILTLYTKEFGKLKVLAKGIKKIKSKLRSAIDLFYLSEIEFVQGKIHKTLTDALLIEKFKKIRESLIRLKIAYSISEILDDLIKGEERDEKIWGLLNETFQRLNSDKLKSKTCCLIYYYFLWNLFSILGYKPELFFCLSCQKKLEPQKIYFSFKKGGLVCQRCQQAGDKKIMAETVKILRLFLEKKWLTLERLKFEKKHLRELDFISKNYISTFFNSQNFVNI